MYPPYQITQVERDHRLSSNVFTTVMIHLPSMEMHLTAGALCVISVIHGLHCVVQLQQHHKQEYFIKRGILLEWGFLISSLIVIGLLYPTLELSLGFGVLSPKCESFLRFLILSGATYCGLTLFGRALLRYMNIRRNDSTIGWKSMLDVNYPKRIPKYYHIFGKPKKLFIVVTVFWIIEVIVGLLSFVMVGNVDIWIECMLGLYCIKFFLIGYLIFGKNGRNFNDAWGLSNELRRIVYISCGSISLDVALFFVDPRWFTPQNVLIDVCRTLVFTVWTNGIWFVTVDWVIQDNHKKIQTIATHFSITPRDLIQTEQGMFFLLSLFLLFLTQ